MFDMGRVLCIGPCIASETQYFQTLLLPDVTGTVDGRFEAHLIIIMLIDAVVD